METENIKELEQIEKENNKQEQEFDNSYLDDCTSKIDITRIYLKDICKYPLLTPEQEYSLGQNLKLVDNLKIAIKKNNIGSTKIFDIDLSVLFKACKKASSYNKMIVNLIDYYKIKSADKVLYEKLNKYYLLSNELKRPLNDQELERYFNIPNDNYETLDENELIEQIDKFLCYKKSFDTIFNSNLRLVVSIARKFHVENIEILDIIDEGNIGLIKAIGNFDSSLGFRFSTYATWQIRRTIQSFVSSEINKIRTPESFINYRIKLKKEIEKLEEKYQRKLSIQEISEKLNIPTEKINDCLSYEYEIKSLNQSISDEDDSTLEEFIPNKEDVESDALLNSLKEDIKELFRCLTKQELDVIKMRYGLDEYSSKPHTLLEIGEKYNVTHQRVSQIEALALRKMKILVRRNIKCAALEDYLEK